MYSAWLCGLLLASLCAPPCHADEQSFYKDAKYNQGEFGNYPRHKFRTSIIEPPRLNFMEPFNGCDDGSYIFVAPRGTAAWSSFFILDHEGGLIWGPDHRYGEVYNFQMQYYKGEPFIMFWAGDDSVGGHGEGKYYMLDQHYHEHRSISAGEGIRGDLHAFFVTDEDTAVFTGYQVIQADLSHMGRAKDSWIWESLFQELDIETGEVLFEWRASQHFPFEDSYVNPSEGKHGNPWDFFHINMVDKDEEGNYLVSTRYGRCVLYISRETGEILWQLGGKSNSFKDLSGGEATTFLGQHDAHWINGHDITMFDNRADWFNKLEDESVGHHIHLDLNQMTAEIIQSYRHPQHILSTSQGSMQMLPNGDVFMGYGFNGAFSEFAPNGTLLCDAFMMPQDRFGSGDVQSYRNLKFNWTGIPLTVPTLLFEDKRLFVSWLGSTKVKGWTIQDSDVADGLYESAHEIPKNGFETQYVLEDGPRMRQYVRLIATDGGGTQLSISNPVDLADTSEIWGNLRPGEEMHHDMDSAVGDKIPSEAPSHSDSDSDSDSESESDDSDDVADIQILLVLGLLAAVSAALVAWMVMNGGCASLRKLPSEKGLYAPGRFQDEGRLRRLWHRVRLQLPWMRRSWQYGKLPLTHDPRLRQNGDINESAERFSLGSQEEE